MVNDNSHATNPYDALHRAAWTGHELGLSVLPPVQDGSKAPLSIVVGGQRTWEPFQNVPASETMIEQWYTHQHYTGLGFVCGAVSRGLELFDFDHRGTYVQFIHLANETGLGALVELIESGYLEETPGDGMHWFYFCDEVRGSTKLARRYKTPDEFNDDDRAAVRKARAANKEHKPVKCLIETKGEGGYAVVAPSFGDVHPSKRPYRLLRGGIETIRKITPEERDALWGLARSFDELLKPPIPTKTPKLDVESVGDGIPPWEDFNARATWEEILEPHGWAKVFTRGQATYWRRPGKSQGVSATTGHGGHDCLYVFTSSTVLEQNRGHDKIGAYVALEHGGDFRAAALALLAKGYGERRRPTFAAGANGTPQPQDRGRRESAQPGPETDFHSLNDEDLGIVPLSSVTERPVRWLWKYRLEMGGMALMAGDAGIGKSQVLLHSAAIVTVGGDWGDGSGAAPIGNVVIVAAEDRPDQTIKPRLRAMGADIARVTIIKAKYVIRRPNKEPEVHFASFQDLEYWTEVFTRIGNIRLFICDPIPSYLGRGVNDSKNVEIRRVLEPFLQVVVEPLDICMWGNTHLNKSVDSKTPLHRITGSIAYGALPRNVHFVVRDPDDPLRRYFKQAKCNDAPDDLPALAFRIEQRVVAGAKGESIETAIPVFEPDGVAVDLGSAIGGTGLVHTGRRGPEPKKTMAVAEALYDFLLKRRDPTPLGAIFDHIGELGLIGHKNEQNRWSSGALLYQARDHFSVLPPPRDGLEVVESQRPLKYGGRSIVHWHLQVPGADPDPDGGGEDHGPDF